MMAAPANDIVFMKTSLQGNGIRSSQDKQPLPTIKPLKRVEWESVLDVVIDSESVSDMLSSGEEGVVLSAYTLLDTFVWRIMFFILREAISSVVLLRCLLYCKTDLDTI